LGGPPPPPPLPPPLPQPHWVLFWVFVWGGRSPTVRLIWASQLAVSFQFRVYATGARTTCILPASLHVMHPQPHSCPAQHLVGGANPWGGGCVGWWVDGRRECFVVCFGGVVCGGLARRLLCQSPPFFGCGVVPLASFSSSRQESELNRVRAPCRRCFRHRRYPGVPVLHRSRLRADSSSRRHLAPLQSGGGGEDRVAQLATRVRNNVCFGRLVWGAQRQICLAPPPHTPTPPPAPPPPAFWGEGGFDIARRHADLDLDVRVRLRKVRQHAGQSI